MDGAVPLLVAAAAIVCAIVLGRKVWGQAPAQPAVGLAIGTDGMQEITVVVRNGFHPGRIRVRAGVPVRLVFRREEDTPCSARVYLSEPRMDRALAPFATTTIAFTPEQVGDHLFTCEEGRFRGHLIVVPPPGRFVGAGRRRFGRTGGPSTAVSRRG